MASAKYLYVFISVNAYFSYLRVSFDFIYMNYEG